MARLFGTDGVRGVANTGLTPELAYRLGRAAALFFRTQDDRRQPSILIGRDTRISGVMFESALAAGICSAGGRAIIAGVVPTPAIAYLAAKKEIKAGIVVSASHNPYDDNGIKFFGGNGYKLPDDVEDKIAALVDKLASDDDCYRPTGTDVGTVEVRKDFARFYAEYVYGTVSERLDGLRVVLDCANGAAYEIMPSLLRRLGVELTVINAAPSGSNINDNCGSTHLDALRKAVVDNGADLGVAHDGDADRCLCVDERGDVIDGDRMLLLCGLELKRRDKLKNDTIVTTVMANLGFHQAAKAAGINVEVTTVGDRYVLECMKAHGYALGGEQSGHIIFSEFATTGDGLITALQVLCALKRSGKKASAITALMTTYPQLLVNVKVASKDGWELNAAIAEAMRIGAAELGDSGRLLVRPSGTEPLLRIMAEGSDNAQLERVCQNIAAVVRQELGQ